MRRGLLATAVGLMLGGGGCTVPMGTLAAVTTREVGLRVETRARAVVGRDCRNAFFTVIAEGGPVPSIETAMDRALAQAPSGDAMTDVTLTYERRGVPYVFEQNCLTVQGDVAAVGRGRQP